MRRDDDKIRIQIDSTVAEFKSVALVLDWYIKDTTITGTTKERVIKFHEMLTRQIMAPN